MDRTIYGRLDRLDALMERIAHLANIECALPIRRDTVRGESGSMNLSLDPNALVGFIGNQPFDTIIRIVDQTSQNGKYDADTEARDPSAMDFDDDFQIWAIDLAGATFLNSLEPLYYGAWLCRDANGNPVSELGGPYFIAIANGFGHALTDTSWWLPVVGSITPAAWSSLTAYVVGNLVTSGGSSYLCILANTNQTPPNATYWLLLPSIANFFGYDGQTTYTMGQYVQQLRQLYAFRSDCCTQQSTTTASFTLTPLMQSVIVDTSGNDWVSSSGTDVAISDSAGGNFVYGIATPWFSNVAISNGGGTNPAVITWDLHGLQPNDRITFSVTGGGSLPSPLMPDVPYFILNSGFTPNSFEVSLTAGGPPILTSTGGSGTPSANSLTAISFTPSVYGSGNPGAMMLGGASVFPQPQPTAISTTTTATLTAVGTSMLLRSPGSGSLPDFGIVTAQSAANQAQVAISNASPAVVTWTMHGLQPNDTVTFSSTGSLPTGMTAGFTYYVLSSGLMPNSFEFSPTPGGSPVNTSSGGSGIQLAQASVNPQIQGFTRPNQNTNVAISNGGGSTPGVVTWNDHGLQEGDPITFSAVGSLPAPLLPNLTYYVRSPMTNSFELSPTLGGPPINTSSAGSGPFTATSETTFELTPMIYKRGEPGNNLVDPALIAPLDGSGGYYPGDAPDQTVSVNSGPYDIPISGFSVFADVTSGGFTVNLPSNPTAGFTELVMSVGTGGNTLTIASTGGYLVNGGIALTTATPGTSLGLTFDGTQWQVTTATGTFATTANTPTYFNSASGSGVTPTITTTAAINDFVVVVVRTQGATSGLAATYDGNAMTAGTSKPFSTAAGLQTFYFRATTANGTVAFTSSLGPTSMVAQALKFPSTLTTRDTGASSNTGLSPSTTLSSGASSNTAANNEWALIVLGAISISATSFAGSPSAAGNSLHANTGAAYLETAFVSVPSSGTPVTGSASWTTTSDAGMIVDVFKP